MENIGGFGLVTFVISFVLGIMCLYYIAKILLNKRIVIKVMADSLGEASTSPSIIAMVCLVLVLFSASFFAVCLGIYAFTLGITK